MSLEQPALLLLHGDERHLVDRDARRWLASAREAAMSDLDVEVFDAPSRLDGLRRSLGAIPFLADHRSVLLRDAPQLAERARRGADSAEALAEAIRQRSPTTYLCIVAHQRVAAGNPVLPAVREGGRVVEYPRLKGRDLRGAVEAMAAERGVRLPRGALEHLLATSSGDLGVIDAELAKLGAYALAVPGPLDLPAVRRLVAGAEHVEIWDLVDRLLTVPHGRGAQALDSLLADGVSTQYLMTTIAGQVREILLTHEVLAGGARGAAAVAAELGLPPWRAERVLRWAHRVDPATAEAWLRSLQQLDADVKMGLADDAAGLRSLVLRAARGLGAGSAGSAGGAGSAASAASAGSARTASGAHRT